MIKLVLVVRAALSHYPIKGSECLKARGNLLNYIILGFPILFDHSALSLSLRSTVWEDLRRTWEWIHEKGM